MWLKAFFVFQVFLILKNKNKNKKLLKIKQFKHPLSCEKFTRQVFGQTRNDTLIPRYCLGNLANCL